MVITPVEVAVQLRSDQENDSAKRPIRHRHEKPIREAHKKARHPKDAAQQG